MDILTNRMTEFFYLSIEVYEISASWSQRVLPCLEHSVQFFQKFVFIYWSKSFRLIDVKHSLIMMGTVIPVCSQSTDQQRRFSVCSSSFQNSMVQTCILRQLRRLYAALYGSQEIDNVFWNAKVNPLQSESNNKDFLSFLRMHTFSTAQKK